MKHIFKKSKEKDSIFLEEFYFINCLSSTENSYTYSVQKKENHTCSILKIFTHHSFSKKKYNAVSRFSDRYFIIPKLYKHTSDADYIIFKPHTTLKEILYIDGLSLHELLDLGIDLTNIGIELKKSHFFEIDISPNNIYRKDNGTFCLGDLNIQKSFAIGTSPYIPPEYKRSSFFRNISSSDFDKFMQFSICMLLKNISMLNSPPKESSLENLLSIGLQEEPKQRFSSLKELQEELMKQKKQESPNNLPVFQINTEKHPLFETKTQILPYKNHSVLFIGLWIGMILSGCLFLTNLYQKLHQPKSIFAVTETVTPFGESHATKGTTITTTPSPAITSGTTASPSTSTISGTTSAPYATSASRIASEPPATKELDVQKSGLTSLPSQTDDDNSISCIYAGENQIKEISADFHFPYIKELYLNDNNLQNISGLYQARKLEVLCISYNNIKSISSLTELKKLSFLDISSNPEFTDMDSLLKMKQLTTLNLSNTNITKKQYLLLCRKLPDCHIIY